MAQAAVKTTDEFANGPAPSAADKARRISLRRITLTDFRSYSHAEIALDGRPVAIAGANGAGKTNFIEAISLIGPGRGLRSARLHELPRDKGDGGWAVSARLDCGGDEVNLGVGALASKPDRRVCRIDEMSASGPSAFADHLRCLWLTPAQDRLFMDGAGERRKFLDRMTLAHHGGHAKNASAFEQAMRRRQRLLDEGGFDDEWLTALESQMATEGVSIAAARRDMIETLTAADISNGDGIFPAADIALDGDLENALQDRDAADVETNYVGALKANRGVDAHAGRCLKGPHRSDLIVHHREKRQAARLCSTGEQKALLIGLVLANARSLAARPDAAPIILLLDEIAAHLDPERRAGLFSIINDLGLQAFMTGTDAALFTSWGDRAQCFRAENSALSETTFE